MRPLKYTRERNILSRITPSQACQTTTYFVYLSYIINTVINIDLFNIILEVSLNNSMNS